MAFGVLFDFNRTTPINITTATNLIKENWFQDAVKKDPIDLFVLIGHNPLQSSQLGNSTIDTLLKYIQGTRPNIPVQVFGGHTHARYLR